MKEDLSGLRTRLEELEQRTEQAEARFRAAERRLRLQGGLALCALVGAILVSPANRAAIADAGNGIAQRVAALEQKTQYVSVEGGEMYIRGTNLHIENGTPNPGVDQFGAPLPPTLNGKGNLIIGFNASRVPVGVPDIRTGSHNLIVGDLNNYSSYGGIVAGGLNAIAAPYASITGGTSSIASGFATSVSGGQFNQASAQNASVSGGESNEASGNWSAVSGGVGNKATAVGASVSGGILNTASASDASVSGGGQINESAVVGWWGGNYHSP